MKKLLTRIFLAVLSVLPMAAIILSAFPAGAQEPVLAYPVLAIKDTQYFMSTFPTGLRYSKGWFGTFKECPPVDEILLFDDDRGICIFRMKPGLEPKGAQGGTVLGKIDAKRANEIIKSYSLEESVKPIDPQIKEIMPHDAYFMGVWSGAKLAEKFDQATPEIKSEIDVTGKETKTVNGKPLTEKQKTALSLYETAIANKEPFDLAKYDPDRFFVMGQVFVQNGSGVITEVGRNIADADLNVTTEGTFTFYMANGTTCVLTDNGDGAAITGSPKTLAAGSNAVAVTGTGTIDFNITIGTTATWGSVNSWSAASGGACTASTPTSADAAKFDANSFTAGSQSCTINDFSSGFGSMDWTGATNTPTLNIGAYRLDSYGNMTFIAAMVTTTTNGGYRVYGAGTILCNGLNLNHYVSVLGNVNLQLGDTFTSVKSLTAGAGTITTNNNTVSCLTFGSTAGTSTLTMGASVINCTSFSAIATTTITANTASIRITGTGGFTGAGKTYYEVQLNGSAHTISGSNTFTNLILKADTTQTITFTDGTNQTITTPTFTGSVGKVKTLQGSGAAGWTVTKAGGGTVTCSYMSISWSTGAPATTWYVNDGTSTDGGNNSGWIWPAAPTVTTQAASVIAETSATLNGTIVNSNGELAYLRGFNYDIDTGSPYDNTITSANPLYDPCVDLALWTLQASPSWDNTTYVGRFAGYAWGGRTGRNATLTTAVDLSTYAQSKIRFNLYKSGTIDASSGLDISISKDNGANYPTTIQAYRGPASPPSTYSYDIPADYLVAQFKMRLELVGFSTNGTYLYIDNIRVGSFNDGAYSESATGLSKGTEYFYRAYATNSTGTGYGAEEKFLTLPDPPAAFTITQLDMALQLDWTAGTGADTTYIRGKTGGYPANIADGNLIYSGAAITFIHSPLVYGDVWYYRAWSYVAIDGLTQYSATYAQVFETVTGTPLPPTNFVATQTGVDEVTLTWVAGLASTSTTIRINSAGFPVLPTADFDCYTGAGVTTTINGLDLDNNTYYFSAWGWNPALLFSTTYATTSIGGAAMTFIAFIGGALLLTWISAKTMWYFRFMASIMWVGLYFYWPTGLRPGTITAGSPVDQILSLLLLAMALGCLFWTFWYKVDGDGQSTVPASGFRIPFVTRNSDDDDETPRYSQTREQRQSDYSERVKGALNGNRKRRRY